MTSLRPNPPVLSGLVAVLLFTAATGHAQTPLTLAEAMTRAQVGTTGARALDAAVDEAAARIRRARSGYWPRVDVAETVQRGDQPVFVFSSLLAQRRFTEANFAIAALNDPDAVTNTRTSIGLDQTVFDGGATKRGVEAARLQVTAAVANGEAVRQDLAFGAAQAFVRVLALEAAARAMAAAVAAAESDVERARARRDAGVATDADVLTVDVHLADMRQQQIGTAADLAVARLQLAEAVGVPLNEAITPVRPEPRAASSDADALVRDALASHPLLRQAGASVELADNSRRSASAAWLPTVAVQAGWEANGQTLSAQQSSWAIGAEVRLNVFRGFADSARLAEARHSHIRASAERDGAARRIEVAIRSALAQLSAARAREEAGRAALAQARESQRIIRDRYEAGLATVTDVLRAAEATLNAESRATAAEMDVILQGVALDRALGRL